LLQSYAKNNKICIFASMKYDIVIFDLDGTLLNTIGDLAASVDYVMRSRNLPEHTDAEYRQMVGGGIKRLVERALPAELAQDEAYVDECVAQFRRYYVDNIDRHTVPYEGMHQLLNELHEQGVMLAVASNKFQHGTDRLVAKFFDDIEFVAIEGNREGAPLKPDPQIVNGILSRAGISKERAVMIGDSGIDIRTAAAAGIDSIGVAWGFRFADELYAAGATRVVSTADELHNLLF
jgi:phosphoglycolate phosphatase